MQGRQHLAQAPTNQQVSRFELKIPKLQGDQQLPKVVLDWVLAIEEVFELNGVSNEQRVSLVVHAFQGRVVAWLQELTKNRKRQGKMEINSWEHQLKNT